MEEVMKSFIESNPNLITGILIYLTLQLIWCGFAMYHMKKEIQQSSYNKMEDK